MGRLKVRMDMPHRLRKPTKEIHASGADAEAVFAVCVPRCRLLQEPLLPVLLHPDGLRKQLTAGDRHGHCSEQVQAVGLGEVNHAHLNYKTM